MPTQSHRKAPRELVDYEELKDRIYYLEDRVEELESLLGLHTRFLFPPEAKISRTIERLIGMLLATPTLSSDAAYVALYADRLEQPGFNVLHVHMSAVRKLLASLHIQLVTIHGFGWAISETDRKKLKGLVQS